MSAVAQKPPEARVGEWYGGVVDGCHLFVGEQSAEPMDFAEAVDWVHLRRGTLPSAAELVNLRARFPEKFQPRPYWSSTPVPAASNEQLMEVIALHMGLPLQFNASPALACHVFCVRRVEISA